MEAGVEVSVVCEDPSVAVFAKLVVVVSVEVSAKTLVKVSVVVEVSGGDKSKFWLFCCLCPPALSVVPFENCRR